MRHCLAVLLAAAAAADPPLRQAPAVAAKDPAVTSLTLFAGTPQGLLWSRDWGGSWLPIDAAAIAAAGAIHHVLAAGTSVYVAAEGGLFVSGDFGRSWERRPLAGRVLAILPGRHLQSDPTIFVGTDAGLFKSLDGLLSFERTALQGTPVYRIEWPGPALVVATGRGVWVSVDAGASFKGVGAGLPGGEVHALALSSFFAADPVLFAGAGATGVHRSQDGGVNWSPAGLAGRRVNDLVWLGPILYAATDGGVFRSVDNGASWQPLGEGLPSLAAARILFPLAPGSGSQAFLATDDGIWRTDDGGERWQTSGLRGERVLLVATFQPEERTPGKKR